MQKVHRNAQMQAEGDREGIGAQKWVRFSTEPLGFLSSAAGAKVPRVWGNPFEESLGLWEASVEVVRKQGGTRALSTQGHPHHPTQPPPRSPPSSTLTFKCVECEIAWSEKTEDGMYWQPLETAMNFTNGFLESSSSHSQIRPITAPLCISADGNGQLPISAKALRPRPSVAQAARKTQKEPWLPKSPPAAERPLLAMSGLKGLGCSCWNAPGRDTHHSEDRNPLLHLVQSHS